MWRICLKWHQGSLSRSQFEHSLRIMCLQQINQIFKLMTRSSKKEETDSRLCSPNDWQRSQAERLKIETRVFSRGSRWRHVLLGAGGELFQDIMLPPNHRSLQVNLYLLLIWLKVLEIEFGLKLVCMPLLVCSQKFSINLHFKSTGIEILNGHKIIFYQFAIFVKLTHFQERT